MKPVSTKEIKQELNLLNPKDLRELCLRLSRFKKENKEFITYLLFESSNEETYINNVKLELDEQFYSINKKSFYLMKKSIRKILLNTRKYIRYSQNKKTEVDLLIYFCQKLRKVSPSIKENVALVNFYNRQIEAIIKKISSLHEDLQYDYETELRELDILRIA